MSLRQRKVQRLSHAFLFLRADGAVLRVLHGLQTIPEQAPFDATTFAFCLLGRVPWKGGRIDKGGEQDGDEQVVFVLDVIKFHRSEWTSVCLSLACVLVLVSL